MKTIGKKKIDGEMMTGRHAAFLITRAAKKYLMRKKVKEDLLKRYENKKLTLLQSTDVTGCTPEYSTVNHPRESTLESNEKLPAQSDE